MAIMGKGRGSGRDVHGARMSGHASSEMQKYVQIGTAALTDVHFYAWTPVGGNATITILNDTAGDDRDGDNLTGTYYEGVLYTGSFMDITLATGEAILYLGEQ